MPGVPRIWTCRKRLCKFKLPRGGLDRPDVSTSALYTCATDVPTHPYVSCTIEGVQLQALIDAGSMRSFIRTNVYDVIDYHHVDLKNSDSEQCASITGHFLHLDGMASAQVKLVKSKHMYKGNFLISNDIPYDCALGWDFLVANRFDIRVIEREGTYDYCLVGSHGKTPVSSSRPSLGGGGGGAPLWSSNGWSTDAWVSGPRWWVRHAVGPIPTKRPKSNQNRRRCHSPCPIRDDRPRQGES